MCKPGTPGPRGLDGESEGQLDLAALPSELPLPVSAVSAGTSAVVVWPPVMQAAMAPAAAEAEVEGLPSCCMLEMGEGTVVVEVGSW
jgi:hypothetical protein